jgi:alpha-ketoglutarate-dependent taurine dioxygenase
VTGGLAAAPLAPGQAIPWQVEPPRGPDPLEALREERAAIRELLDRHGALLFRGLPLRDSSAFEAFVRIFCDRTMGYQDRAAPRTRVSGNVFTATDFPPAHDIFVHNESAYAQVWPSRIAFFCITPPVRGGETPLADVRRVLRRIAPEIRERFRQERLRYVRNFGNGLFGLSWQDAFQTCDRSEMERYCREAEIEFEWLGGDRVRTRQVRPAVVRHPRTAELAWFNHAAALHVSTVEPRARATLRRLFREEDLPSNVYYGDGAPIEPEVMDAIREAYRREIVSFPWQEGDVLILDNLLVAHGRRPFAGPRNVAVAMADPLSWSDV